MLATSLYDHRRYFALFVLVIIAVGFTSFTTIPRQEDPTLTNFTATLLTPFPGATPDRVEALVTRPLEDELMRMDEIDELYSTSSTGISSLNVALDDTLSDEELGRAWSEVRDAIADARREFPSGVGATSFDNDRFTAFTTIIAFSGRDGVDMPLSLLHRLTQDFADLARNMPGTKLVELFGEPKEEIRVAVDEAALASRGLSLDQVAGALAAADARSSAGRATGDGADIIVEVAGALDSLNRVSQVIVSSDARGRSVRVGDIARVYKAQQSPPDSMALAQGKQAILVAVRMQDGERVDRWSERFRTLLDGYRAQAPAGLLVDQSYDQSTYTNTRLAEVALNLLIGVALVLLVLLFTMGWRAAVVVAVVLPLCGIMSVAILERLGMALHQMSITGLIVALGLLVDGSIVMTDEVGKRLRKGQSATRAIRQSVGRLRIPLLSSTATTILAFMPMVILPGVSGDFMGSIAISVVVMLGSSLLLALIFTPALAAWLLPRGSSKRESWMRSGINSGRMGNWLARSMDWTLRHQGAAIALALVLPITGLLAFPTLTAQFFPGTDRDQMYLQVKLADGRSIYETRELVAEMDPLLRAEPLIRRVDWTLGESPPPFYYNMLRYRDGNPTWAEALVLTHDENQTDALIRRLQRELSERFPQAQIVARGIDQGPPVKAPLEVEIYGPDLGVLAELGEQYRQRMEAVTYVTSTTTDLIGGAPKIVFDLDEDKLRIAGLQLSDAAAALDAALVGRTGGEVLEGTERLPVRIRLGEEAFEQKHRVRDVLVPLSMPTADARIPAIPLSALGESYLRVSQSPISRFNGERRNVVQAQLVRGILPEEALKALRADLDAKPIPLPTGYRMSFGGDSDVRAEVMGHIMAPMGFIIAALFATIVLTFNSWRLSAVAMLVMLCSAGLSLLALAIFNYPFGVQAVIGVIGSIGVSVNAAIIIMTALQRDEAAMGGGLFAIREVVMDSSRHIVSTTLTTFGGFLPLILEGSQFWPPFAMAIAGGVLLSTIVSFFLVPPLFALLMSRPAQPALEQTTSSAQTINENLKKTLA